MPKILKHVTALAYHERFARLTSHLPWRFRPFSKLHSDVLKGRKTSWQNYSLINPKGSISISAEGIQELFWIQFGTCYPYSHCWTKWQNYASSTSSSILHNIKQHKIWQAVIHRTKQQQSCHVNNWNSYLKGPGIKIIVDHSFLQV